jgi:MerR family transcriptional regulator, copper efflux regulator
MRIGQLAERAGVSQKTLRYYEDIGVLGHPRRTPGRYRDYDESALVRLRFVQAAQAIGLTLGEIRKITGLRDRDETPCEHVAALIRQRAGELDQRIEELQRMRTELRWLARRAGTLDPVACAPDAVCHIISPPRIASTR